MCIRDSQDDDGLEGGLLVAHVQTVDQDDEGLGIGHVSFENFMGEREAVFVEGHADGDLTAVVSLLLIPPALGFRVFGANAFEMSIGYIVKDDAAFKAEKALLRFLQLFLYMLLMLDQLTACPIFLRDPHIIDCWLYPAR